MNPEFRRNVWIELSSRRLATMTAVVFLIFLAASSSDSAGLVTRLAEYLFYFIVVFWGSRNAALSVVGEIRDRTWDFQRLSALGAGRMMWGKLFGSTIFNWYGGALCLLVIVADRLRYTGSAAALTDLVYFLVVGMIAQSVALLASLVAALRRQTHSRLEVFIYQAAGLLSAIAVYNVWSRANPAAGSPLGYPEAVRGIPWWGQYFDAPTFLLSSLAIFAAWTLLGCYRTMRVELRMKNGPYVWLAFLVFMGVYVAGFDAWLPATVIVNMQDTIALRLALAGATLGAITYAMVLFEPKERILYRRLGAMISVRRFAQAFSEAQGWMIAYLAAFLVAALLVVWLALEGFAPAAAMVISALGFLTRDVGIFVLLQASPGRQRGDFGALVTLLALYVLAPMILHGGADGQALVLFYPRNASPIWLGPLAAWAEALTVATLSFRRLSLGAPRATAQV